MKKQYLIFSIFCMVAIMINSVIVLAQSSEEANADSSGVGVLDDGSVNLTANVTLTLEERRNIAKEKIEQERIRMNERLNESKERMQERIDSVQEKLHKRAQNRISKLKERVEYRLDGEKLRIENKMEGKKERMNLRFESLEGVKTEVETDLEIEEELNESINQSSLRAKLSNGKNAEIKIMPSTASKTALFRLGLKVCGNETKCKIELKEVGQNGRNSSQVAYKIQARKRAKLIGLFNVGMDVSTEVDAETGQVIQTRKPWWAFLARERLEDQEVDTSN